MNQKCVREYIIANQKTFWHDLDAGDTKRSFISTVIARINDHELHPDEYKAFGSSLSSGDGIAILRSFWALWSFVQTLDAEDETLNLAVEAFTKSALAITEFTDHDEEEE